MAKANPRLLANIQRRLVAARESQRILEEQVQTWNEALDDMRIRTLVSETPQVQADYNELSKHVVAARTELQRRSDEVEHLVRERDELLREWVPKDEHG